MDKGIWVYGKDTTFKPGDNRTKAIGRKGGFRSGETRYLKALRRKQLRQMIGDLAYCDYMVGVTEEELKAFIKWRRDNGTDSPIAESHLKDEDPEDTHRRTRKFVRGGMFLKGNCCSQPISQVMKDHQEDYDVIAKIINRAIFKTMEELHKEHFDIYKWPPGFSRLDGFKERNHTA